MRNLFIGLSLLLMPLAACAEEPSSVTAETVRTAENLSAALIYADWCSACQVLDPRVEAARAAGAFEDVNYAVLDYTDRDGEALFAAADAAGMGEAVRAHLANGIRTGQLLLIDTDRQDVIGTVRKDLSAEEIAEVVAAARS